MNRNHQPPQEKNSFWDLFRFTKNGKPQSSAVVMTFSYSLLFLAVYMISYFLLIDVAHALLGGGPAWLANLAESLAPAIVGAMLCALPMAWVKEKQYVLLGYVWLAGYAVALLLAMVLALGSEPEARALFLRLYAMTAPPSILLGGGLSSWLYRRYRKNHPPLEEQESWKRL